MKALYYLRRSFRNRSPKSQTVYGLAFAYMELGDIELAQKHFQKVLALEVPEELRVLARNGQWEIAFEIGMLGQGCGSAIWTSTKIGGSMRRQD